MSLKQDQLYKVFLHQDNKYAYASSMRMSGRCLYTYDKVLAKWSKDFQKVYINMDKYSKTSSTHRNGLIKFLKEWGLENNIVYSTEKEVEEVK